MHTMNQDHRSFAMFWRGLSAGIAKLFSAREKQTATIFYKAGYRVGYDDGVKRMQTLIQERLKENDNSTNKTE